MIMTTYSCESVRITVGLFGSGLGLRYTIMQFSKTYYEYISQYISQYVFVFLILHSIT